MSENPLIDTAEIAADGPGTGIISISFLIHSFTKIAPGSDMLGVPASQISETIRFYFSNFIIFDRFFFSLNLWFEMSCELISYLLSKFFEIRVSSHNM